MHFFCFFIFERKKKGNFFYLEYLPSNTNDVKTIRRTRSISRSFKNLFRSNSKKKLNAAKTDALGEFENGNVLFFRRFCLFKFY